MSAGQLRSTPYPIRGKGVALSASALPDPTKRRDKEATGRQFAVERHRAVQRKEDIDQLVRAILGMNVGDTAHEHYWSTMDGKSMCGRVTQLKRILKQDAKWKTGKALNGGEQFF